MRGNIVAVGLIAFLASGCAASGPSTSAVSTPNRSSAATAAPTASTSCPTPLKLDAGQGIAIDYVDTLRIQGRDFKISDDKPPETWDPSNTAGPVGTISCTLSTQTIDPDYRLRDGDATFLPVGTEVYLALTADGVTEAIANVGGRWRVYLPAPRP